MKKIIIVNNNMKVGGVQKSLYNLLWEIEGKYDITVCLFRNIGEYADKLPPSVKTVEVKGPFGYLGISQGEAKGIKALKRGILAALCHLFGRNAVLRLMLMFEKALDGKYDCAISFLHNGGAGNFYGGVQEFVLSCVNADKKVAFLHCDYRKCGADHRNNNEVMAEFDRIAACSEGCRRAFLDVIPELEDKTVTVRNCHRIDEILGAADDSPVLYEADGCNIVMVSRLTHEKGIERAIRAVAFLREREVACTLHIVGGGPMSESLQSQANELGIRQNVRFYGEQGNPYRFMKNADLFLLTSYHEAAPMVIDEAKCIGLPILTVETTSSREMVIDEGCGWVCDNDQESINKALLELASDPDAVMRMRASMNERCIDNKIPLEQFDAAVCG